ncbi:hypothetical protein MJH12_13100 [bacterium]|nr:hypothetical protein [bacterium]
MKHNICPCNLEKNYQECCQPYHNKSKLAASAQTLMRSRYSAYVKKDSEYLFHTTHPSVRNKELKKDIISWIQEVEWVSLEILESKLGNNEDKIGKVEFIAEYKLAGQSKHHHELSNFKKHRNQWMYVDGTIYS